MSISLVGKKCGMTRIFTEDGTSIPVSLIQVLPNRITQVKTVENDGYQAVQVTTGSKKRLRLNKPQLGHYAKAGVEPGDYLLEFSLNDLTSSEQQESMQLGSELTAACFTEGQYVDVRGKTKGKGFAGVIKKYHFSSQDASHGNSLSHRAPGSIGQRQSPGRVFKGKKMCGQMGNKNRTVLSQKIIRIDQERGLIFVKGAIPGATGGYVVIRNAIKKMHVAERG